MAPINTALLAKCQLQLYRLEHLLDSKIPHPIPTDPKVILQQNSLLYYLESWKDQKKNG